MSDTSESISTRSAPFGGFGGNPSIPSIEADGAKMDEVQTRPDRAAKAGIASVNPKQAAASIRFTRACVPGEYPSASIVNPVAVRTCARLRWRAHSDITPGLNRTRTPPAIQSVAPSLTVVSNAIAAVSSPRWRRLREPVEHGGPSHVLRAPAFLQGNAGTSGLGFLNLFRRLQAAGSLLLRSLVHDANQPTRGFFETLILAPIRLPSLLSAHESNVAKGSCHERQVSCKG